MTRRGIKGASIGGYYGFMVIFIIWVMVMTMLVFAYDRYTLHILLNSFHTATLDKVMMLATHLGDGLFIAFVAFILLFISYRWAISMATSGIVSGLLAQSLKRLVFNEYTRPVEHLDQMAGLYIVPELELSHMFSFPSGHSTTAFAMFCVIALGVRSKVAGALCGVLAVSIAFTRVYLSQHFAEDILAGSMIGVLVSLLCWRLLTRINGSWVDRGLLDLFRK